jgi:hypothetical protein
MTQELVYFDDDTIVCIKEPDKDSVEIVSNYEKERHLLFGDAPPISPEIRDQMKLLFAQTKEALNKCSGTKNSPLSFSYLVYKYAELLKLDDLTNYVTLPKNTHALQQQDIIWKKVCNELQLPFTPTCPKT